MNPMRFRSFTRSMLWLIAIAAILAAFAGGLTAQAAVKLEGISVEYGRDKVRVVVRSAVNWDFATLIVLIDSDDNPDTGFISTYRPAQGFDLLLQHTSVHRFTSPRREDWQWQSLGQANRRLAGRQVIFDLDAKLFRSNNPRVVAMAMSQDWQIAEDIVPREDATLEVPAEETPAPPLQSDAQGRSDATPEVNQTPAAAPRDDKAPIRHRMRGVRTYACFYGGGQIDKLGRYDLAILHPQSQTAAQIASLKKYGTIAIGYLSVGEDDVLRLGNGKGPGQYASWYFDRDGDDRPDRNVVWKSYFANAADPAWRKDRVDRARELINDFGFQGIFLDTIDTVDLYPESRDGMVDLVRELRREFPHIAIVLNNGFTLLPRLAPMSDGLMIESFTSSYDRERQSYFERNVQTLQWLDRAVEEKVRPMVARYGFPVLALDYCRPDQSDLIEKGRQRAGRLKFLHAVAPYRLDELYELNGESQVNAEGGSGSP